MTIHNLASLTDQSQVLVDTNIFFIRFQGRSAAVNPFITRIALGEISAYVNILVFSDLMHKLILAEAFAWETWPTPGQLNLSNGCNPTVSRFIH
jgi:hypothetical protein